MLRGTLAAAVTPLRDAGATLDEGAVSALVDFLAAGGVDGVFALGSTGEGVLLSESERRRAAELFREACEGRLALAVHCGAQSTAATEALAAHAAEAGADAVAVIAPPYYVLDEGALVAHFTAAARACAPVPFFLYVYEATTCYPLPPAVVDRVRDEAPNLAGLKVSGTPFPHVEPYLVEGLAVLVGAEVLVPEALTRGAVGTVSALASAFPELVSDLVRNPSAAAAERVGAVRASLQAVPFHAALKRVLALRGLPVKEDVRRPLRTLTAPERAAIDRTVAELLASPTPEPAPR